MLALATDFALPVTASYLAGPPGTPAQDPEVLFDIPTGAAVAGFLMWNLSPARIFLGDSGSHFVGFFLGAVALYTEPVGGATIGPYLAFVVAAAVFAPFLFDTAYTLVRRARARW